MVTRNGPPGQSARATKSEPNQKIPAAGCSAGTIASQPPDEVRSTAPGTRRRGVIEIVIGALERGGTERHLAQVLPGLQALGWSPRVHTLTGLGPVAEELARHGVPATRLASADRIADWPRWLRRSAGVPLTIASLRERLGAGPSALVWTLLPEAYLLTMLACATLRDAPPVVMSRRSMNAYQSRFPGIRAIERRLHRRTAGILANSEAVRGQLVRDESVPPDHVSVIANGIALERFDQPGDPAAVRAALGVPVEDLVLTVVANLIPYKGHADLLRALAAVKDQLPSFTLLCAGGGDPRALSTLAADLGLEARVRWLGSRSDVPALLAASDIGVLPSHEEGSSNAVLEYMAARLPVVATDVGGNPEAVVEGETGHLVPARSPAALAHAIRTVATAPMRAREMGAAGRTRVETTFSMAACVQRYDVWFAGVLERATETRDRTSSR